MDICIKQRVLNLCKSIKFSFPLGLRMLMIIKKLSPPRRKPATSFICFIIKLFI